MPPLPLPDEATYKEWLEGIANLVEREEMKFAIFDLLTLELFRARVQAIKRDEIPNWADEKQEKANLKKYEEAVSNWEKIEKDLVARTDLSQTSRGRDERKVRFPMIELASSKRCLLCSAS